MLCEVKRVKEDRYVAWGSDSTNRVSGETGAVQSVRGLLGCCFSRHSVLRLLQLQRTEIMPFCTDATGCHPGRLHSLLAGPDPRDGKIHDHGVPVAEVHLVRRLTIEVRMGNRLIARPRVRRALRDQFGVELRF